MSARVFFWGRERERVYFPHSNNTWISTQQKYKIRRVVRKALNWPIKAGHPSFKSWVEEWRVMDDESGELMELMEEVPIKELGDAKLEKLVRGWRREARSWFQRRGEAYRKERSVIRREDDVDGWANVTKDEERVLRGGWTVIRLCRYEGWVVVRTL